MTDVEERDMIGPEPNEIGIHMINNIELRWIQHLREPRMLQYRFIVDENTATPWRTVPTVYSVHKDVDTVEECCGDYKSCKKSCIARIAYEISIETVELGL